MAVVGLVVVMLLRMIILFLLSMTQTSAYAVDWKKSGMVCWTDFSQKISFYTKDGRQILGADEQGKRANALAKLEINKLIKKGWQPVGERSRYGCQTMVRK